MTPNDTLSALCTSIGRRIVGLCQPYLCKGTLRPLIIASFALCFSATAQAPLDVRIALVIGNSAYTQVPHLKNPGNDAQAVGRALGRLGFTVIELLDGNKEQMLEALEKTRKALQGQQGLGMLYYAGHGLQLNWHNYMVPVDMRLTRAADLPRQALDMEVVINTFKNSGTRMNILVLDACRDNPFDKSGEKLPGLANMTAPVGTFLAYATQPGNVAEDGDVHDRNGPYAIYLSNELAKPLARLEDVFKRVRFQVRQKTQGRQIPWESTSLEEDFMFNDGRRHTISPADLVKLAEEARVREQELLARATQAREQERLLSERLEQERIAQAKQAQLVEEQRQARLLEAQRQAQLAEQQRLLAEAQRLEEEKRVLARQAQEREARLLAEREREVQRERLAQQALEQAREMEAVRQQQVAQQAEEMKRREALARLAADKRKEQMFLSEKMEWDRVKDTGVAADLYAFLQKFPTGAISELAQAQLEKLDKPKIQPVPDSLGLVQPFEARRFRLGDSYQYVVRDLNSNFELERPTFTVVSADADSAEFNRGSKVTQAGAIIRTIAGATMDPHQQWFPSGEYQVGKKWYTRSNMKLPDGRIFWVEMHGKIVARETITVPAGTFDTFRMELEQVGEDGERFQSTYWAQPEWGSAVKQIRRIQLANGRISGQIYELLSRQRKG